ncbi:MAG: multiple sugar transport system permease protein [Thermococcaceae archaeon]|nr:multiple sugar transport system permease protein [Thermococcaceae archaeon]
MGVPMYKLKKYIVSNALAWTIGIIWLIPFIGVLMASIRPYEEIVSGWWHFDTFTITLENYIKAFNHPMFPISDGKHYLFAFIVFLMALPQQMTVVPLYFLLRNLHMLNTFRGLITVHSAWGLAWIIFFMRNYFSMLPTDVEEAARTDGATDFQIFYKIVLPMALPGLISAAILQFTWVWSDFFLALVFLQNPEKYVATQRLPLLRGVN